MRVDLDFVEHLTTQVVEFLIGDREKALRVIEGLATREPLDQEDMERLANDPKTHDELWDTLHKRIFQVISDNIGKVYQGE